MTMNKGGRYIFTNYSTEPFDGKMGGVPYHFESGETREFDADKHGMLVVMAKHLADRELLKRIKGVGRDPQNQETWGKSLDEFQRPFTITTDLRKEYIRKAVGDLVDIPVPIPEEQVPEGGATGRISTDVTQLQGEVKELKEMVATLINQVRKPLLENGLDSPSILSGEPTPGAQSSAEPPIPTEEQSGTEPSLARSAIEELATDVGIIVTPTMTKKEILEAISQKQTAINK